MTEYYEFVEPPEFHPDKEVNPKTGAVHIRKSREEILEYYYPYWQEQMRRVGKEDLISEDRCIEDWVVVNWAQRVEG